MILNNNPIAKGLLALIRGTSKKLAEYELAYTKEVDKEILAAGLKKGAIVTLTPIKKEAPITVKVKNICVEQYYIEDPIVEITYQLTYKEMTPIQKEVAKTLNNRSWRPLIAYSVPLSSIKIVLKKH